MDHIDGGFRHGGGGVDVGRYGSFKSLLLDDAEVVEEGEMGGHLVFSGSLEADDALYRDEVASGRESFKSLLLDGGTEEDEVHFTPPKYYKSHGNGNLSVLAAATKCSENGDSLDEQEGVTKEDADGEESTSPPRKRGREKLAAESQNNHHSLAVASSCKEDSIADNGEQHEQPQPSRSPSKKKKQASELSRDIPPPRKKKQGTSSEVQKLLDSVIERQERFFADLLESMERKEEMRERIRAEKEDKWRAEERAQLYLFNNAMIALTQELSDEPLSNVGRQLLNDRCTRDR